MIDFPLALTLWEVPVYILGAWGVIVGAMLLFEEDIELKIIEETCSGAGIVALKKIS